MFLLQPCILCVTRIRFTHIFMSPAGPKAVAGLDEEAEAPPDRPHSRQPEFREECRISGGSGDRPSVKDRVQRKSRTQKAEPKAPPFFMTSSDDAPYRRYPDRSRSPDRNGALRYPRAPRFQVISNLRLVSDCLTGSVPPQACSSSTSVPLKSFGCRNSTGLSWAPIFGSPSPSTRIPSAFSRSRAA